MKIGLTRGAVTLSHLLQYLYFRYPHYRHKHQHFHLRRWHHHNTVQISKHPCRLLTKIQVNPSKSTAVQFGNYTDTDTGERYGRHLPVYKAGKCQSKLVWNSILYIEHCRMSTIVKDIPKQEPPGFVTSPSRLQSYTIVIFIYLAINLWVYVWNNISCDI